jgi:predicted MFS family arabinose efflux permease
MHNRWLTVCALSLGPVVGNGFARFGYALLLPAMKLDMQWSYTEAGWINTANAIGYLIGAAMTLRLVRHISPGQLFRWGMVVTAVALGLSGVTRDFGALLAWRMLSGLGAAPVFIAGSVMAAAMFPSDARRTAMAIAVYFGGAGAGIVITGLCLPLIVERLGASSWPVGWLLLGACSVLATVAAWRASGTSASATSAGGDDGRLPWVAMLPSIGSYFLFGTGYIVYMTFLIAWMRLHEASVASIVATWVCLGAAVIVSPWLWRYALSEWRGARALAATVAGTALGALIPVLWPTPAASLLSAAIFGVSFFMPPASVTAYTRKTLPPRLWGRAVAMYTTVFSVGQILGPTGAGWLADATGSLRSGLLVAAAILFAGALAAMLQHDPKLREEPS